MLEYINDRLFLSDYGLLFLFEVAKNLKQGFEVKPISQVFTKT